MLQDPGLIPEDGLTDARNAQCYRESLGIKVDVFVLRIARQPACARPEKMHLNPSRKTYGTRAWRVVTRILTHRDHCRGVLAETPTIAVAFIDRDYRVRLLLGPGGTEQRSAMVGERVLPLKRWTRSPADAPRPSHKI